MADVQIELHAGNREHLLPLFRLADESESQILSYYEQGHVLVAIEQGMVIGLAHLVEDADTIELVSLAVVHERRGKGVATRLIKEAKLFCGGADIARLVVCTGSWETDNIIFYLKRGFRIFNVVRNFFTPEKGYALAIRDQVQFEMEATPAESK